MDLTKIVRCQDLGEEQFAAAVEAREDAKALLAHVAVIARPNEGAARVLILFARLATGECDWLEGALRVVIEGGADKVRVDTYADIGGGLKERALPRVELGVPLEELAAAVDRYASALLPLVAERPTARKIVLAAAEATKVMKQDAAPAPQARVPTAAFHLPSVRKEIAAAPIDASDLPAVVAAPVIPPPPPPPSSVAPPVHETAWVAPEPAPRVETRAWAALPSLERPEPARRVDTMVFGLKPIGTVPPVPLESLLVVDDMPGAEPPSRTTEKMPVALPVPLTKKATPPPHPPRTPPVEAAPPTEGAAQTPPAATARRTPRAPTAPPPRAPKKTMTAIGRLQLETRAKRPLVVEEHVRSTKRHAGAEPTEQPEGAADDPPKKPGVDDSWE